MNGRDTPPDSCYDDPEEVAGVAAGGHREIVGGLWQELGTLQFEFLKAQGLRPGHRLLDIGCGALRGGVHFIRYLNPGDYWGVDKNPALLDAGWDVELAALQLQSRQPREQLLHLDDFQFEELGTVFDFALAQSVFTHLSLNRIRRCLARLAGVVKPGGLFYATFFEVPRECDPEAPMRHGPEGLATFSARDPYHYRFSEFLHAAAGLPWTVRHLGDWNHPRGQHMAVFVKVAESSFQAQDAPGTRLPPAADASHLAPGDPHYRAFVGPPDRFDFMSATQFSLLFAMGLRENHRVLDFGCGSLRLGRLLIPFLREDLYFGIDPEAWLIEDGLDSELGRDILAIKRPRFAHNRDFDCSVFGETFDYVMAQSIVTHAGVDLASHLLASCAVALEPNGLLLLSYIRAEDASAPLPPDGWHYPGCVSYPESGILGLLSDVGLHGQAIPWYHPGARWVVASRDATRLPNPAQLSLLRGAVLCDPQFDGSWQDAD